MAGNLERSKEFFDKLSSSNLHLVDEFYDKNTVFQDPVHQLKGSQAVKAYYAGLYKNVESIQLNSRDCSNRERCWRCQHFDWTKSIALLHGHLRRSCSTSLIEFNA